MTRSEEISKEAEKKFDGISRADAFRSNLKFYNRAPAYQWYTDYNKEQMDYLWRHGYIKNSLPKTHLGESTKTEYIEFTEVGRRWNNWYTTTLWEYIGIYIIRKYWWRSQWRKLMTALGKHYDHYDI